MTWPVHIVTVSGLIEDANENVLLVKSARRNTWETCGGQVEMGENLEEALIREVREESGVEVSVRCLAGVYSSVQETIWHDGVTPVPPKLNLDFLCDYRSGELRTSDETTEVIWCPRLSCLLDAAFCRAFPEVVLMEDRLNPAEEWSRGMKQKVILLNTDHWGKEDAELGKTLLETFLTLLKQEEEPPAAIFCMHRGVLALTEGSVLSLHLREIEDRGVPVLACKTCVDYYGVEGSLYAGKISSMKRFLELAARYEVFSIN